MLSWLLASAHALPDVCPRLGPRLLWGEAYKNLEADASVARIEKVRAVLMYGGWYGPIFSARFSGNFCKCHLLNLLSSVVIECYRQYVD